MEGVPMERQFLTRLQELYDDIDSRISAAGVSEGGNKCGSCSQCCHYLYRFPVSSLEIEHMLDRFPDMEHPAGFKDFLNGQLKKPDGTKAPCPYCAEEGCRIYSYRPMCCRLYGLSPFRPLISGCVYAQEKEKANAVWRELTPLFKKFIDLRFEYYENTMDEIRPVTITDFLDRGNIHLVKKSYEEAFNHFKEAMSLNPDDPTVYTYFATFYEHTGQPEKSIEAYDYALKLDPLDYSTHIKAGFLLHSLQRFAEAEEHYRKALSIDPGNAQAWGNIGLICISTSRLDEADEAYKKAVDLEPGNSVYHVCWGNVFYARQNIEKTIESMKKALSLNPGEELAYLCLGSVYEKTGELEKSMDNYSRFLEHSKDEERKKAVGGKIASLQALQKQV
jgi:Tfp pilus assembly protein PilF